MAAAWIWRRFPPSPCRSRSGQRGGHAVISPPRCRQQAENKGRRMSWHAVSICPKADFQSPQGVACQRLGLNRMIMERCRRRGCTRPRLIGRKVLWRHIMRRSRHQDRTGQKGWPCCRFSCDPAAQAQRGRPEVTGAHRRAESGKAPVHLPAPSCGTVRWPRRTARRGTRCSQGPSAACSSRC